MAATKEDRIALIEEFASEMHAFAKCGPVCAGCADAFVAMLQKREKARPYDEAVKTPAVWPAALPQMAPMPWRPAAIVGDIMARLLGDKAASELLERLRGDIPADMKANLELDMAAVKRCAASPKYRSGPTHAAGRGGLNDPNMSPGQRGPHQHAADAEAGGTDRTRP